MREVDALVVGGGPAGSSCARALARRGARVGVLDRARFPRDKVCAGWVTPPVFELLEIDPADYARHRVLQRLRGFRVGVMPGLGRAVDCGETVSFGVRRCEFDDFLLRRSGAELWLGEPLHSLRRERGRWIANESIAARALVGAGGNFCPVARRVLGTQAERATLVRAQEVELRLDRDALAHCPIDPELPELFFCADLAGYGWAMRKGEYLNLGLGRVGGEPLPAHVEHFLGFLSLRRALPLRGRPELRGHAYRLYPPPRLGVTGEDLLLVGDAAGLAAPYSGEGIRPAVESGLLAARAIDAALGSPSISSAERYASALFARFGAPAAGGPAARIPARLRGLVARGLVGIPRVARSLVVERWFLQRDLPPLAAA